MKHKEPDSEKQYQSSQGRRRDAEQESKSPTTESGPVSSLHRAVGNQAVQRMSRRAASQGRGIGGAAERRPANSSRNGSRSREAESPERGGPVTDLAPETVAEKRRRGAVQVVDVRSSREFQRGHVPEAVNLPASELFRRNGALDHGKDIVVCCQSGQRSEEVTRRLSSGGEMGAKVANMRGGYDAWRDAVGDGTGDEPTTLERKSESGSETPTVRQGVGGHALQARLGVSHPDDPYEREARRVAAQVMELSSKKQDEEGSSPESNTGGGCLDCQRRSQSGGVLSPKRDSEGGFQRTGDASASESRRESGTDEARSRSLAGNGRPLTQSERSFFEPRFGRDFSEVRVHTGIQADRAARSIDAQAFTIGNDIAFAKGNYRPDTTEGKELMAHELTHVVQQKRKPVSTHRGYSTANTHHAGPAISSVGDLGMVYRSEKGAFIGAGVGAAVGAGIGGYLGGIPGALIGGVIGAAGGAIVGALMSGRTVTVDKSCDGFCSSKTVTGAAKTADSKASSSCTDVSFRYNQGGTAKTFNSPVSFDSITIKCSASESNCGGWSSDGEITLGKAACNSGSCGPLKSTILHEMVHDWAGWNAPYDKKNTTVPGASHTSQEYLDEWVARYVEKSCFGTNPWGLP